MLSPMPPTIKDVAKVAGVSVATVSRVMNGHAAVTPETRARILGIAKELKFTPSGAARSLIMKRTQTIGALLPDLHGEYFSELIRGIDLAARARGLHLLVSSSHGNAEEAATALRAMHGRVDGMLVMTPHLSAEFLEGHLPSGLPAVLMNACAPNEHHASFQVDNYGGAREMTQHLWQQGHRRIAFVAGPVQNHEANERLRGYREALTALSRTAKPSIWQGDFTEETGYQAARQILEASPRPTAIFAANDMMALGCMAVMARAQLQVPQDISVVGFDDIPIARYVTPALTTVRVPIVDLGSQALAALALQIERQPAEPAPSSVLQVQLVHRQSCAPPPRSSGAA
ncbi:MAG: LacI family transcriptional regulator [Ideonella sp. MAG2]|nr:MAG: LacI family transcriptional regulator [Ideonella sp. MAG2]